jgi:hypothetical protein
MTQSLGREEPVRKDDDAYEVEILDYQEQRIDLQATCDLEIERDGLQERLAREVEAIRPAS